jgi:hypothetical protein
MTVPAVEVVGALARFQGVVAGVAVEDVVAVSGADGVVAGAAVAGVAVVSAQEGVVAVGAGHPRPRAVAGHDPVIPLVPVERVGAAELVKRPVSGVESVVARSAADGVIPEAAADFHGLEDRVIGDDLVVSGVPVDDDLGERVVDSGIVNGGPVFGPGDVVRFKGSVVGNGEDVAGLGDRDVVVGAGAVDGEGDDRAAGEELSGFEDFE